MPLKPATGFCGFSATPAATLRPVWLERTGANYLIYFGGARRDRTADLVNAIREIGVDNPGHLVTLATILQ